MFGFKWEFTLITLRYVNVKKLYQTLGNSLCVSLSGFHAFTGSDYTASFSCKGKIPPLKLLERSEDAKKAFCFKRTIT